MKITYLYEQDFNLWRETTIKQNSEYSLDCPFSINEILDDNFYG